MTSGKLYFRRFLKEILLKDRLSRTVSGSEVCEPHAFWKSRDPAQLSVGGCAPWWPSGPAQEAVREAQPDPWLP